MATCAYMMSITVKSWSTFQLREEDVKCAIICSLLTWTDSSHTVLAAAVVLDPFLVCVAYRAHVRVRPKKTDSVHKELWPYFFRSHVPGQANMMSTACHVYGPTHRGVQICLPYVGEASFTKAYASTQRLITSRSMVNGTHKCTNCLCLNRLRIL